MVAAAAAAVAAVTAVAAVRIAAIANNRGGHNISYSIARKGRQS